MTRNLRITWYFFLLSYVDQHASTQLKNIIQIREGQKMSQVFTFLHAFKNCWKSWNMAEIELKWWIAFQKNQTFTSMGQVYQGVSIV